MRGICAFLRPAHLQNNCGPVTSAIICSLAMACLRRSSHGQAKDGANHLEAVLRATAVLQLAEMPRDPSRVSGRVELRRPRRISGHVCTVMGGQPFQKGAPDIAGK